MANKKHLIILEQGKEAWNIWRKENPKVKPDLYNAGVELNDLRYINFFGANLGKIHLSGKRLERADLRYSDLSEADLSESDLSNANLYKANLCEARLERAKLNNAKLAKADLTNANLFEADLSEADLSGCCLINADLIGANMIRTNLSQAKLNGSDLTCAVLVETVLKNTDLSNSVVYGISAWNLNVNETKQHNLIITPPYEATIKVDNLEIAQFIYLLLNSNKIRDVINVIANKAVLILGRFNPKERKDVLESIADQLRRHPNGYIPIIFDFEKPFKRDTTETLITLASISKFIIADLTDQKSTPYESHAIVPIFKIPFVPIIVEAQEPFSMFYDLVNKYKWVLQPVSYKNKEHLVLNFDKGIIERVEHKYKMISEEIEQTISTIASIDSI